MSVFTRFSRLLKADVHALLDTMEAPDVLLKQALREMEAEHSLLKQKLDCLALQKDRLQEQIRRLQQQQEEQSEGLSLCLQQNNDALARSLLRKQLEARQLAEHSQQLLTDVDKDLSGGREQYVEQQAELERIRQRASLFMSGHRAVVAGFAAEAPGVSDADVELALLQAKAQRGAQ